MSPGDTATFGDATSRLFGRPATVHPVGGPPVKAAVALLACSSLLAGCTAPGQPPDPALRGFEAGLDVAGGTGLGGLSIRFGPLDVFWDRDGEPRPGHALVVESRQEFYDHPVKAYVLDASLQVVRSSHDCSFWAGPEFVTGSGCRETTEWRRALPPWELPGR